MAQAGRIEILKAHVAVLKTAPLFNKAAQAEKVIDALVEIIAEQDLEIKQLKGVSNG